MSGTAFEPVAAALRIGHIRDCAQDVRAGQRIGQRPKPRGTSVRRHRRGQKGLQLLAHSVPHTHCQLRKRPALS